MEHHSCCHGPCGHDHQAHHDHDHGCGVCCGHDSTPAEISLNRAQAAFLARFAQTPYLPVARLLLLSSTEEDISSVAFPALFLDGEEDMDTARATGDILTALEDMGLITLDHDIPLDNYDYGEYKSSAIFAALKEAVAEGAGRPGFLFDTAAIEMGSMALTELGQAVLEQVQELL